MRYQNTQGQFANERKEESTYVTTRFYTQLDTAFKAILGVRKVIEVLIVSAETEPCCGVASTSCGFKVAEGSAGVMSDVIGIGTAGSEGSTKKSGFGDV